MNTYHSDFAQEIENFVSYRKASDTWNEHTSAQNLKYFDRYCAEHYTDSDGLTQDMVDSWCVQRDTETGGSCYTRTLIVREFVKYLCSHSMTGVVIPKSPKLERRKYIPHAFTDGELAQFFEACDSIIPFKGRLVSVLRKLQCPVFFRLLYSSGMRTTEARYLKREDVDLEHGVVNTRKSKGYDQHYVALHDTMTRLLIQYDEAVDKIQPERTYFFESLKGMCYGRD